MSSPYIDTSTQDNELVIIITQCITSVKLIQGQSPNNDKLEYFQIYSKSLVGN